MLAPTVFGFSFILVKGFAFPIDRHHDMTAFAQNYRRTDQPLVGVVGSDVFRHSITTKLAEDHACVAFPLSILADEENFVVGKVALSAAPASMVTQVKFQLRVSP
jgi:hypothetical protein